MFSECLNNTFRTNAQGLFSVVILDHLGYFCYALILVVSLYHKLWLLAELGFLRSLLDFDFNFLGRDENFTSTFVFRSEILKSTRFIWSWNLCSPIFLWQTRRLFLSSRGTVAFLVCCLNVAVLLFANLTLVGRFRAGAQHVNIFNSLFKLHEFKVDEPDVIGLLLLRTADLLEFLSQYEERSQCLVTFPGLVVAESADLSAWIYDHYRLFWRRVTVVAFSPFPPVVEVKTTNSNEHFYILLLCVPRILTIFIHGNR